MAKAMPSPAPSSGQDKKPKDSDAMLNLFATQVVEESTLGKFAAALQEIDMADILKEAVSIRDQLRGMKR
jgi:hypothetical protein